MKLTDTQRDIASAIQTLTPEWEPVATVGDIAEETGLSDQAVRNNIEDVVENIKQIKTRKIGQTNVYYYDTYLMLDEIEKDDTVAVSRLTSLKGDAVYGTLREVSTDGSYYYEAHWYDRNAEEIDGYIPTQEEVGALLHQPRLPPTILWEPEEVEHEQH